MFPAVGAVDFSFFTSNENLCRQEALFTWMKFLSAIEIPMEVLFNTWNFNIVKTLLNKLILLPNLRVSS